jgi:hypothetical protein
MYTHELMHDSGHTIPANCHMAVAEHFYTLAPLPPTTMTHRVTRHHHQQSEEIRKLIQLLKCKFIIAKISVGWVGCG